MGRFPRARPGLGVEIGPLGSGPFQRALPPSMLQVVGLQPIPITAAGGSGPKKPAFWSTAYAYSPYLSIASSREGADNLQAIQKHTIMSKYSKFLIDEGEKTPLISSIFASFPLGDYKDGGFDFKEGKPTKKAWKYLEIFQNILITANQFKFISQEELDKAVDSAYDDFVIFITDAFKVALAEKCESAERRRKVMRHINSRYNGLVEYLNNYQGSVAQVLKEVA